MGHPVPAARGQAAVLVLNAGSSSLKAALFSRDGDCLWREQRSWCPDPHSGDGQGRGSMEQVLDHWLPPALAGQDSDLLLAAHRVVHGGERFTAPTRLDPDVLGVLEELVSLAPLHNGPALRLMRWLIRWRPHLPQWACFDTAFHSTLPPEASTYALPQAWREQGLRRFGFHGLSHQHVSETVSHRCTGREPAAAGPLRLISCHLGAGCSLCAIRAGRSLATTMGFTPLEGLVMATRSGSVDPGLLLHLLRQGLSPARLEQSLQSESGLLGLSGLSGDMRELRRAAAAGHDGATLALAVFRQSLLCGIGAMAACLGGVDVIALTGGIGEHDDALLTDLEDALAWLRPFELLRIPADEEGVIARSCLARMQAAP
ncbi:acetate/propionate family kinase [Synechococcus sp. EJ6-Ellesmere]|uniref:acetate/propionate family kinase n=1 Tax=Synechococcus sp. EJ6-Ellesmere TaxID=2823734 RepID=UPI0020CBC3C1|nr:acetate kinase [Synechococcus sp. EJ6-Ellesmere]MCP9826259.1 acetate kinase [Synechococcus sp. EJ6-Ellesmere]